LPTHLPLKGYLEVAMARDGNKVFIVYFSPAGSTRHVARIMEKRFKEWGIEPSLFDLANNNGLSQVISEQIRDDSCLIVGSPVYVSHAAPPVMQFLAELPPVTTASAVPYVTWGGASSGIALFEMARELGKKGFKILGAARVMAVHCLMWQLENPLGEGHPNSEDERIVEKLVDEMNRKMQSPSSKGIDLSDLAYQKEEIHAEMEKMSLEIAKAHLPVREVDQGLCNQCEICAEVCPTASVVLEPYPVFGKGCIYCFSCMRNCPEGAIKANLGEIWQRIRDRAESLAEAPCTKIFIASPSAEQEA
ncbi:MAG: EFR1 family ferrodoxin, partial [Deltaproteobacteria bacterium]